MNSRQLLLVLRSSCKILFLSVIDYHAGQIFQESFSRCESLICRVNGEGNGISFNRWNGHCQRAKYQIEVACTGGHVIPDDPDELSEV